MRSPLLAIWLAAAIPVLAASESARDWDRLSRVGNLQNVKVHLRDGRVLKGRIQRFELDGLIVAEEKNWIRIKTRELQNAILFKRGEAVEISFRNGKVLEGTAEEIDLRDNFITFAEAAGMTTVNRSEVARVTRKPRGLAALWGALAGAVCLGIFAFAGAGGDTYGPDENAAGYVIGTSVIGAGIGAGIGAAIAWSVTIYKAD